MAAIFNNPVFYLRDMKRHTPDTQDFIHKSADCRIDFQSGLLICVGIDGDTITKRITLARSTKKKDEISIFEALRLAGLETTGVHPATLSFTPYKDPDSNEVGRVYVPVVIPTSQKMGFLYDDGGRFGFTTFVAGGTKVFVVDYNSNVVIDVVGQDIPTKEEFEKALNKFNKELDFLGTYREVVVFVTLYPYLYVHFLRRPIVTVTGPFRSGKTTVLELVQNVVGVPTMVRGNFSLAGARGLLAYRHVILDDFGEGAVLEDPNISMLLQYHDRGLVAKVNDRLQTKIFPLRGVMFVTGGYAINLLRLSSYVDRLFLLKIALSRNMMNTMSAVFNSLIKDADYYRWAFSRLYLYFHEYYQSLTTWLHMPWRRDDIFVTEAINYLIMRTLDGTKEPTLTVENMAQNAKRHAADVHMAILLQILRAVLKRRAQGFDKIKNKVFKFKGQDTEFYHVQYVHRLEIPSQIGHGTESVSETVSIGATKTVSKSVSMSRAKQYASPSMIQAIIDMYPYLSDYFIVAAPDGKNYSVWVKADAVDEAIRWLIFTLQEHAPHYLDNFPTLVDEVVRKAYEDVMRRLEGDKFKNE
jgi:hypothetical protein